MRFRAAASGAADTGSGPVDGLRRSEAGEGGASLRAGRANAVSSRNLALDGLRGYAALAVVFWHAMLAVDPGHALKLVQTKFGDVALSDLPQKLLLTATAGDTAVVIFFVLSGAVLFQSLRHDNGPIGQAAVAFAIRRVFRIYPALWFALALTIASVAASGNSVDITAIASNVLLYDSAVIGPTWTLNVEILATALILASYAAYRRYGELGLVCTCAAAILLAHAPFANPYFVFARPYLYCFAAGMLVPTPFGARLAALLHPKSWILLLVAMLCARHVAPGVHRIPALVEESCAALLVLQLFHHRESAFGKFLARPLSVFFGRISYSLYLLNVMFVNQLATLSIPAGYQTAGGVLAGLAIVMLTVPIAWVSFRYVELPAIAAGARIAKRLQPTASVIGPSAAPDRNPVVERRSASASVFNPASAEDQR